jgi:hypothetical protein
MAKRENHAPAFKAKVALAALSGEMSIITLSAALVHGLVECTRHVRVGLSGDFDFLRLRQSCSPFCFMVCAYSLLSCNIYAMLY